MKIALAQINTTIGDFQGNLDRILDYVRLAGQRNADLVVFPELAITGYPPKDLLERPDFIRANLRVLRQLAKKITKPACVVGFVDSRKGKTGKPLANAAALIHKRKIIGTKHKHLLPTYDVFDEGRYFEPGLSSPVFDLLGKKIGISICEDIWTDQSYWGNPIYSVDPILEQAYSGAEYLINLSASPFSVGRGKDREKVLGRHAKRYGRPVVYVNLVGGNDDLVFDGGSLVINGQGRVVTRLKRFSEDLAIVNMDKLRPLKKTNVKGDEEVLDALTLGLKDYMRKCDFKKTVIGLSGGIDSALTAWIAVQAVGAKNVLGVSMPSPYSSKGSVKDAENLARSLGVEFRVLPISGLFTGYKETLSYEHDKKIDVTLQNIQARIRGNLLMAISNREGRLLLTTGNKSEMSIGYCTLYGDMAGGFSVLIDVPKTMVYRLARLANRRKKAIPVSSITKPPSAELAPDQTDQDDLPSYEVLDDILSSYIENQLQPEEILKRGHQKKIVTDVLKRLDNNEYKRMQAPPGIRITNKAFGYGRRVPISSRYRVKL